MKISYNWLKDLIPAIPEPEKLSALLTSVGLEVENLAEYEEIKGSLAGLTVGKVLKCEKHPGADKLKVTEVDAGNGKILQIICGASNIDVGQMVIVAIAGAKIYPINGEPVTIKKAKIRGIESNGMICAEDEIGLGNSHDGIIILPGDILPGTEATAYFNIQTDWIFEIGITPNRIDAMSHLGVAKDVCAYLSYHSNKKVTLILPVNTASGATNNLPVEVVIESAMCERYTGVSLGNIKIEPSPKWLQARLKSIGVRPVNNLVDITNYILQETGQPLHAYDLADIKGQKIMVKELPEGTPFTTLDEKKRMLHADDVMICNGVDEPMCIGGVFGGLQSGVKNSTTQIFLESAWFKPSAIRKTSLRHKLRTDAAIRFEKGVDISQTARALERAISLITTVTGAKIQSEIVDIYPNPKNKTLITLGDCYLKKITGKEYKRSQVKSILEALGFQVEKEDAETLTVAVPFSKPDVTLPADLAEEIMRIDGFDNVAIPSSITITPALETNISAASLKEKTANYLAGSGFSEIFTNSITNSKYYDQQSLQNAVKILNSLSADLDIMRPSTLETGLESVAYNLNRKNNDLLFFEFGNTYFTNGAVQYNEKEHLCLYISGNKKEADWKEKPGKVDFYYLKGICQNIFTLCGLQNVDMVISENDRFEFSIAAAVNGEAVGELGVVNKNMLKRFEIKQPVLFADLYWKNILFFAKKELVFNEIPKFPSVSRDLSIVVNKNIVYAQIDSTIKRLNLIKLKKLTLFDVFESEKLGSDKKAFAISLTFVDTQKTLTDYEIDNYIIKIVASFKEELGAQIRE